MKNLSDYQKNPYMSLFHRWMLISPEHFRQETDLLLKTFETSSKSNPSKLETQRYQQILEARKWIKNSDEYSNYKKCINADKEQNKQLIKTNTSLQNKVQNLTTKNDALVVSTNQTLTDKDAELNYYKTGFKFLRNTALFGSALFIGSKVINFFRNSDK